MSAARPQGAASARRFKPYPAYKDSGVEWLGEIPAHWEVKPLKWGVRFLEGPGIMAADFTNDGIPLLRIAGIGGRTATLDGCNHLSPDLVHRRWEHFRVRSGDLLISGSASTGFCSEVDAEAEGAVPYTGIIIIRPRVDVTEKGFLRWFLLSGAFLAQTELARSGSAIQHFGPSHLSRMRMVVPPLAAQVAIAAFLDRETARIGALVAKKERLIELLQENRTALITWAVTKGLDPDVPMKDSGIEWLGEIPAHWEVERIKWAARMESGHTPDKQVESYWVGGDIPWVSLADTGQLREVDYIADTAVMTTSNGIAHSSAHILPEGTVVFSRDATIGLCAITRAGMAVSQHFIGWVCSARLQPEYLLFVLRSMTQELERLTMGATVRTIGMPDVRSLVTPIPPVPEQERIVLHVHKNRAQIDALVGKVRDAIGRLKELRTALISAAVTGKIDVREEAA